MLAHAVLTRPVVIRADRDDAREGVALEPLQRLQDFLRRVATDADEDRHTAGNDCDGAIDDRLGLVVVDRGTLARRPDREDPGDTLRQIVLQQLRVAREVHRPVDEWSDDGQPDTGDLGHRAAPCPVPETQKARDRVVAGLMVQERSRELVTSLRRRAPPSLGVPFAGTPAGSCRSRGRVGGPWPSLYHTRVALPAARCAASAGRSPARSAGRSHTNATAPTSRATVTWPKAMPPPITLAPPTRSRVGPSTRGPRKPPA